MATTKKTNKKQVVIEEPVATKKWKLISAGWLVELSFRTIVGVIMLTEFDHVLTLAVGFYSIITSVAVVATHIALAHKQ